MGGNCQRGFDAPIWRSCCSPKQLFKESVSLVQVRLIIQAILHGLVFLHHDWSTAGGCWQLNNMDGASNLCHNPAWFVNTNIATQTPFWFTLLEVCFYCVRKDMTGGELRQLETLELHSCLKQRKHQQFYTKLFFSSLLWLFLCKLRTELWKFWSYQ